MFPLGNGTGRNPLLPLPPISELAKVNLSKQQRHLTVQYSPSTVQYSTVGRKIKCTHLTYTVCVLGRDRAKTGSGNQKHGSAVTDDFLGEPFFATLSLQKEWRCKSMSNSAISGCR